MSRFRKCLKWILPLAPLLITACGSNSSGNPATAVNPVPPLGSSTGEETGPLTGEGKVMTNVEGSDDFANSITVQPDGKILVTGRTFNGTDTDSLIVRYLANGTLDSTFGSGGIVTADLIDHDDNMMSLLLQPDGKIVIAGISNNGLNDDFSLVRYLPDGNLDSTFGAGGIVITDVGGSDDQASSVRLQPDGKLVVGGMSKFESMCTPGVYTWDFVLVRHHPDGSLDDSFGIGGIVSTDFYCDQDYGGVVYIQSDGKILLVGSIYISPAQDFSMARYLTDGTLDATFGNEGIVVTELGAGYDFTRDTLIQSETTGKIIVAGTIFNETGTSFDFGLIRYLPNGDMDPSFGTGGIQTIDFSGDIDVADGMIELPDGKLVLAGWTETGTDRDFALACLLPDGTLDLEFGTDGKMSTDFGFGDDSGHAVALGIDNTILVAGSAFNGQDFDIGVVRYGLGD